MPDAFSRDSLYTNLNVQPPSPPIRDNSAPDLSCLRPPILESVKEPEKQGRGQIPLSARATYWYQVGRTHFTFYKNGLKKVWANHKERRRILSSLDPNGVSDSMLPMIAIWGHDRIAKEGLGAPLAITRRDFQLCVRTKRDLRRMVPFLLVLAVFGEWTPVMM